MKEEYGKVLEVYIPDDNIESQKIGFKIDIDGKIENIVQDQDEFNSNIYRDDSVLIRRDKISGKEIIDIELVGEEDE